MISGAVPRGLFRCLSVALLVFAATGCTVLVPTPANHDFGQVFVGQSASSPQASWRNVSNQTYNVIGQFPLPLGGPFALPRAAPFTAFNLAPNATTPPVTFTFSPTATGLATGQGTTQITATGVQVQPLELRGTGVVLVNQGDLAIIGGNVRAGEVLNFGSVAVPGGRPTTRAFELFNLGQQAIRVRVQFVQNNQGFSVLRPALPINLPSRRSVRVELRFAPPAVGDFADVVQFVDANNAANSAAIAVVGRGVAPPGGGGGEGD